MKIKNILPFLKFLPESLCVFLEDESIRNENGEFIALYLPLQYIDLVEIEKYGTDPTGDVFTESEEEPHTQPKVLSISCMEGKNEVVGPLNVNTLCQLLNSYNDELDIFVLRYGFYRPLRNFELLNITEADSGSLAGNLVKVNNLPLQEENLSLALSFEPWETTTVAILEKIIK